jgi:phage terminase large subunit GpA-like protein
MSIEKRLNLLDYAKKLTGSSEMSTLIQAATELESFLEKPFETLIKQAHDFNSFLPHCMIQHSVRGTLAFDPYPYQTMAACVLQNSQNTIINSARQMGTSVMLSAFALWSAAFKCDQNILMASHSYTAALNLISTIRFMIEHSTAWLPKVIVNNKHEIQFDNGSRIFASAITQNLGRGMTLNTLIIDNAAFIPYKLDNHVKELIGISQTFNTKVVLASTPKYQEGLFWDLWSDPTIFQAARITFDLSLHPDATERASQMKETLGAEMFKNECECQFITRQ